MSQKHGFASPGSEVEDRQALARARKVVAYLESQVEPPKVDPRIAIIDKYLNGQGITIITASEKTGLDLADACALVEQESAGHNVFGHDPGGMFQGLPVTPERVHALISQPGYRSGSASMNGVGLTQLTWYTFVLDAEERGGAHVPLIQCLVGFELMAGYLRNYGRERAFASYNAGEGNWTAGKPYAAQVMARAQTWRGRLASVPPEPGPDPGGKLLAHGVRDGTKFAEGHKVLMQLIGHMPYEVWRSGDVPDGPMAWGANRPLPPVEDMMGETCACMGVGNIYRRAAGKIVPTRGNAHYDGGVAAYWYSSASFPGVGVLGPGFFSGVDVPFNLATAKQWARESGSGVLIGRTYRDASLQGQGHIAVLLPDGKVMQSYIFGANGEPGLNDDKTIEQSHAGGYYELMVAPQDWILHDKNQF